MAKKKEPSLADSLNNFKDTMLRASLSNYVYVNRNLITTHPKGYSVIIIPEKDLWTTLIDDDEMKKNMREVILTNPDDFELSDLTKYCDDIDNRDIWIELDAETLYKGKIIRVKVHDDFEYDVPINRDLLPLKLKKAEYNDIAYRIFTSESPMLCIKKRFNYPLPDAGFTMIRVFSII